MPDFTPEEQRLIYAYARDRGPISWISFYLAVLTAPVAMAAYGMMQSDVLAMSIAFFGLLALIAWGVSSSVRNFKTTRAICMKLASTTPLATSRSE